MKQKVIIARKTRLTALERLHKSELQKKKKNSGHDDTRLEKKIPFNIHFTYLVFKNETEPTDMHEGCDYIRRITEL